MGRARLAGVTAAALAVLVGWVPAPASGAPSPSPSEVPQTPAPQTPAPQTPASQTQTPQTPAPQTPPYQLGDLTFAGIPSPAIDRPSYPAPDTVPEGFAPPPSGAGLTGYLAQRLDWTPCGFNTVCANVLAPLDYANPGAQAITLSLRKKAATASPRIGTLFVNPGGPGGSGKSLVPSFETAGLERFDIVGWDPRGVGASTPVVCYDAAQTDALLANDPAPTTQTGLATLAKAYSEFAKSCWDRSGPLLEHISTIETVRDLDLLRALVGDEKLNYFGYSYGTRIGAVYAELFGQNAGRLVLDGAVDITYDEDAIQAVGFDLALSHFAAWCVEEECSLGTDEAAVVASITGLFEQLGRAPVLVGNRRMTKSLAVTGVGMMLYGGADSWPRLKAMVELAIDGDPSALMWAADQLNSRGSDGRYGSLFYSFPAISCLDEADQGVLGANERWAVGQQAAPVFGKYFGPDYVCPLWPARPARQLAITGRSAPPIVVIGGTGDNATPYPQAVTMARQLASGVLVTYESEGHGAYGGNSECVDDLVVAYLADGIVPADGTVCS